MKKLLITILVIALLIAMIPIRVLYKDGGSVEWRAVLCQVRKYHKMEDNGYRVGTKVTLFMGLLTIYDHTEIVPYDQIQ